MKRSRAERLAKLHESQLYFVCDAAVDDEVLEGAVAGGCGLIQLRDKELGDDDLISAAERFRKAAGDRALFFLNDRPDLAAECGADGVHVGQRDAGVAEARMAAGADRLVGLSTHGPDQLAAACEAAGPGRPDYLSVGPVWATPTKPGRPATGLDYVGHAAERATLPWFAIGGIDTDNLDQVIEAGARRAVVVRAIRDAADPAAIAGRLSEALSAAGTAPAGSL